VGVLGSIVLGAAGFCSVKLFMNHKSLSRLEGLFGTTSYADLKGKIAVIREARIKRDTMLSATDAARNATETARERYENSKRELTALILKWGEEPPISEL
jgi:hypothetical protein